MARRTPLGNLGVNEHQIDPTAVKALSCLEALIDGGILSREQVTHRLTREEGAKRGSKRPTGPAHDVLGRDAKREKTHKTFKFAGLAQGLHPPVPSRMHDGAKQVKEYSKAEEKAAKVSKTFSMSMYVN
jgi:hypothetical protein